MNSEIESIPITRVLAAAGKLRLGLPAGVRSRRQENLGGETSRRRPPGRL